MEDHAIIDLYWAREERALEETETKYGSYCRSIARNILASPEDTEECVNASTPRCAQRISGQNHTQSFFGPLETGPC